MSQLCTHCGRRHSGICGIPAPRAGKGFSSATAVPVNTVGLGRTVNAKSGNQRAKMSKRTLEKLLAEARRQEREVLNMLKAIPHEVDDYDRLVLQLDKLQILATQLNGQIAGRKTDG